MPSPVQVDTVSSGPSKNFTYLALGDSYTIGQSVPATENYPNQAADLLKKDSLQAQVKIIATTGWTTDQLKSAIANGQSSGSLLEQYDIVTLLIGVNNQYQGQDAEMYKPKFEDLLRKAISLAGNKPNHVIVLSIPDWGYTPFGASKEPGQVTREINAYNVINKQLSLQYGVSYIDVTPGTRDVATDSSLLAGDGLHYSGKEYLLWAEKIEGIVKLVMR